jgi:uncharacterized integral membrane protein
LTPSPFSDSITVLLEIALTRKWESPPMTQFYLIVALLLATVVAIFAVQNAQEVTVRFLAWSFQSSVVVVILISAGLGALLAALISLPQTMKAWRRLRESERRLKHLAGQSEGLEAWEAPHGEE